MNMHRYMQQMIVAEFGAEGQRKLGSAKVLVIGAGGLGTIAATFLAAAGVGTLGIADDDRISVSNLSRQFLFDESEAGKSKAKVLATKLGRQNPAVVIQVHDRVVNGSETVSLFSGYDIVCDCTDNAEARIMIDGACDQLGKPLVYAAVRDWEGYVTVLHHKEKISLDLIFSTGEMMDPATANCSVAGIVNTTCGIAGSIQACEVQKIILGLESDLDGGILCFNTLYGRFRNFKLQSGQSAHHN